MIKLSNRILNETDFMGAFNYLRNQNGFPVKVAWNLSYMGDKLDKTLNRARDSFQGLLKKYAVLDEKGAVVPNTVKYADGKETPQPGTFVIRDECKTEWEKEFADFLDIEVEINKPMLKLDDLQNAKLSPNQLLSLSPIISDMELVG